VTGRRVVTSVVVLLAAVAGCGGGDDPASLGRPSSSAGAAGEAGQDSQACALLSRLEVSEAVGAEMGPGRGTGGTVATGGNQSTCEWFSVEQPGDTAKLTIYSETTAADSVRDSDPDAEPLPGIGDEAFVGSYASVWVYHGDQSFMAQWYSMTTSDEQNLPRSEALARLAADRL
jgi:hypothetical protein